MLVEIFEGVFVRADQVNEIQARKGEDFAVRVWLYDHQPEHSIASRVSVFDTAEDAQQAAREIQQAVNLALERGSSFE